MMDLADLQLTVVKQRTARAWACLTSILGLRSLLVAGGAWLAVVLLAATPARATTVEYHLTALGGSSYRYVYTVTNDGSLGGSLGGFDVFFDPSLILESSLTIVTPAALAVEWNELILGSGVLVPAAYDALALAGGIPNGGSASGFAVDFTWIGPGTPGAQAFEIFDPDTFAVLEAGFTTAVPEPNASHLLAMAVVALVLTRRSTGMHATESR
jgi:hypothetical protein